MAKHVFFFSQWALEGSAKLKPGDVFAFWDSHKEQRDKFSIPQLRNGDMRYRVKAIASDGELSVEELSTTVRTVALADRARALSSTEPGWFEAEGLAFNLSNGLVPVGRLFKIPAIPLFCTAEQAGLARQRGAYRIVESVDEFTRTAVLTPVRRVRLLKATDRLAYALEDLDRG